MKSSRLLLGAAGLVFFITLVTAVPARVLSQLGGDALQMSGATGTLWNGSAQQVLAGPLRFGQTRWKTRPTALLLGRLSLNIDTELPGGYARGDVSVSVGGTVRLSDIEAAAALESLGGMVGLAQATGDATIQIESAVLENNWPTQLVGEIRLGNIPLAIGGVNTASNASILTEFDVPNAPADDRVVGAVSDQGGPLAIAGSITLYPPANYDIDSKIKTRPDAPPELSQGLMLLGPEGADGSREFTMSGSL